MTNRILWFQRISGRAFVPICWLWFARSVAQWSATLPYQLLSIKPLRALLACNDQDGNFEQPDSSAAIIDAQMNQEQRRYQAILEDQTELICRYLSDTTILYVNDAFCRYFGLTKQDLIGKSYSPVVYDADRREVERLVNSMSCDNPQVTIENRVLANGVIRWTQWNSRCFCNKQGQIIEYQAVGRDIHQHKETEAALRESEQRYRTLIETIPQLVWVASADGLTRIDFSKSWFSYTGQTPESVIGMGWLSIIHPNDVELSLTCWSNAIATETSYEAEHRLRRADGVYVWHLSKAEPVRDQQGQIVRWYGTCTDISARKRYEIERQQAEVALQQLNETLELRITERTTELLAANAALRKEIQERLQAEQAMYQLNLTLEQRVQERTEALEEANQELEAFSYSVAHDLRAPLRAIQGFAQVLEEDYGGILDDLGQEYINRMATSAAHLDVLIADLLSYSQLGRSEIYLQQVSVAVVLESILTTLEPILRDKQAEVMIESELPIVRAQRSVLKQILINLIDNALKFVPSGGQPRIRIWAEPQTLLDRNGETQPQRVRIWVADNGIGIASKHQERIFNTFERLHGVEAYPGTGIGLAIVKRGVERLGGHVGVVSAPNQGSQFWIELSLA